ncbi:hypothetical protein BB559_000717 [Furculomyces boomerangus]|uniref:Uncharacterized protein n=1 Tax=Furculomyces boomerangus TaxID=61424 RepID=A0A2T9Z4B9_9FUNG|nr:hypothetical protein BB559_000717 [Furculomyces boomerangus]
MFFKQPLVLLASAAALTLSQSTQTIQGYSPAGMNGNTLLVSQGQYPVPDFSALTQLSDYNPLLYTSDNITESGWTLDSLSYLKTLKFDATKIGCLSCVISSTVQIVNGLGSCCGGWCMDPEECCFYNVACGYWYGFPPLQKLPLRPAPQPKAHQTQARQSQVHQPKVHQPQAHQSQALALPLQALHRVPIRLQKQGPMILFHFNEV